MIKDDRDTNSQIGQNGVANSNEIEIFHPHQIILNLTPMKLIPLMIIQIEMEMNLTLVKIILVVRLMKMTVTVKIRNITWFTKKKIMAFRIIFISLKYQSSIMPVMLNMMKNLEMVGNGLKKIQGHFVVCGPYSSLNMDLAVCWFFSCSCCSINALGNVVRVYPEIIQDLTFYCSKIE